MGYGQSLLPPCVEAARKHLNFSDTMLFQFERHTSASEVARRGTVENNIEVGRKQNMLGPANLTGVHPNGSRNSFGTFGAFLITQEVEDKGLFTTADLLPQTTWLDSV